MQNVFLIEGNATLMNSYLLNASKFVLTKIRIFFHVQSKMILCKSKQFLPFLYLIQPSIW